MPQGKLPAIEDSAAQLGSADVEAASDDAEEAALLLDGAPLSGQAPSRVRRALSAWQLAHEGGEEELASYRHETWRILQLAAPLVASGFFSFALSLIAVAFVGRIGETELSIAVFATSLYNVTATSVLIGFVGALETVAGQLYGARNYRACGIALQRSLYLSLLISALVAVFWTQMERIMLFIGQDPVIARGAARYLHLAIPSMVCTGLFESIKRYLQSQGIVTPATLVSCAVVTMSPLFYWLLIFRLGWGLDGAAMAMNAAQLSMLCLMACYTVHFHRQRAGSEKQTWPGWSREALAGWGTFLKLGVPSTVMVCLEWWAYELTVVLSGWLVDPALHVAAMGVCLNISGLCYMIPMGVSSATSVRVSNALGAGLPNSARRSAYTACGITILTQTSLALALALGRGLWASIFTSVPGVVATAGSLMPILAITMWGDGLNCVMGGMLRGAGRQELGALMNLASFWGLGLPAAALLTFKAGWGVQGLWSGLAMATSLQGCVMLVVLSRFNWHKEARAALERCGTQEIVVEYNRSASLQQSLTATSELALTECAESTELLGAPGSPLQDNALREGEKFPRL